MVVAVSQSTIAKRFRITSPLSAYCFQARVPVTLIRIPTNSLPRFRLGTSLFITLSNANAFFFISAPAIYQRRRDNGSFSPYVTIHVIRKVCLYRVRMHIEYQAYNGVRFTRIDRIQMRINLGGKFVSGLLDRVEDVSEGRWYKISNWNWKWIRFLSEKKYLKDENILFFLVARVENL